MRNVHGYHSANAGTMARTGAALPAPLDLRIKPTIDKTAEAITRPRVTGAPRKTEAKFIGRRVCSLKVGCESRVAEPRSDHTLLMARKLDSADVTRTVRELLDELKRGESDVAGTIDVVVGAPR